MVRRPVWLRLAAGALALWLGLVLVDPPALHACPMHDARPAGARAGAGMPRMPGMSPVAPRAGASLPDVAASDAAGAPRAPRAHPAHVLGCTCLGACALGLVALLASAPEVVTAGGMPTAPVLAPVAGAPVRGMAAHFLPFAQAPPLLA